MIVASPRDVALVRSTIASLPACVQQSLGSQVRGIVVTYTAILGPDEIGTATADGIVIVVESALEPFPLVLLHELGHEVDFDIGASTTVKFRRALWRDFADLTPSQRRRLTDYRQPAEAFAELFAQHYASKHLYDREGPSEIKRLKRTQRLVNQMLDELESCADTL